MLQRNLAPALQKISKIKIPVPEKILLDNGIPLYIINNPDYEVLKVEIIFKAGSAESSDFLVAPAVNKLLEEGTSTHDALQISETFDFYGSHLQTECSPDWAITSLYTINKFRDKVIPLLNEIITEPVFPGKQLEIYKQQNKQLLQVSNEKADYVARQTLNQKLFGNDHPYGYYAKAEDLDSIQRDDLITFHRENYLKKVFAIIISGHADKKLLKSINSLFGNNLLPVKKPDSARLKAAEASRYFIAKENALQSAIRIGKILFNKTHADHQALSVLNTLLGGYFGSRLMSNIREKKGYTYSIGSGILSLQQTGYFFIATEVGIEVRDAALREIYLEINNLQNELVPEEELDLVKNYLAGSLQRSMDGAFALADRLKGLITYGLDFNYFHQYLDLINAITPRDIQKLARKYLQTDSMTEVSVG